MSAEHLAKEIERALAFLLKEGGVIAVPTDTTYGLICRLDDPKAQERIYEIKNRDWSKPLIILATNAEEACRWQKGDHRTLTCLAGKFWPGALTVVVHASQEVPRDILAGKNTVGLRVPDHKALRKLLAKLPFKAAASTSANLSGKGIPKDANQVKHELGHLIDYIMDDCNQSPDGSESTIVEITGKPAKILRVGALKASLVLDSLSSRNEPPA